MLNICLKSKKTSSFTGRINAFRVIERQNTESFKVLLFRCCSPAKMLKFFIYKDTSLKLDILMYYDILRNIS